MRKSWSVLRIAVALMILGSSGSHVFAETASQKSQPAAASPQKGIPGKPSLPTDESLTMLINSTLIALNQANSTGNYSVFREMGAPGFQVANSTGRLAETFAQLRSRNFDLSPIMLLPVKLLRKPELSRGGMLRVTGFFPTRPEQLNFDLIYQPIDGRWRLFGIAVDTTPVIGNSAQAPSQASPPTAIEPPKP